MSRLNWKTVLFVTGIVGLVTASCNDKSNDTTRSPQVSFEVEPASGIVPFSVEFHNTSDGPFRSWYWSFGDGDSSAQRDPKHEYGTPGTYNVYLIGEGGGRVDTSIALNLVEAWDSLLADFTLVPPEGCTNSAYGTLSVKLTNTSRGTLDSCTWDLPSQDITFCGLPGILAFEPGTHAITLTVYGQGSSSSRTRNLTVSRTLVDVPRISSPSRSPIPTLDNGCLDGSNAIDWNFTWNSVSGAQRYEIEAYTTGRLEFSQTVYSTSYAYSNLGYIPDQYSQQQWFFRVRACNGCGCGPWDLITFYVEYHSTDCGWGLVVYTDRNYSGIAAPVYSDVPDLHNYGWGDKISSIKLNNIKTVTLYEHKNYQGRSETYSHNVPNLGSVGQLEDRASSLRITR